MKTTRCTLCEVELTDAELEEAPDKSRCPACGTRSTPQAIKHDMALKTNWQDLRILANWAWEHSRKLDEQGQAVLEAVLARIRKQRPTDATGLTIVDEMLEVQREFPTAELKDEQGRTIVPPKRPKPEDPWGP